MVAAGPDAGQDRGLGPRVVRRGYGYADPSSGHRHARSVAHGSSAPYSSAEPPPPGWRGRRPIDVAELPESAAQLGEHGLIDRVVLVDPGSPVTGPWLREFLGPRWVEGDFARQDFPLVTEFSHAS